MNKIKLNGEFSKEELQEKLKEFDKSRYEIKEKMGSIILFKKGCCDATIARIDAENIFVNLSTISRDMAEEMNDLMETKDVVDKNITGYSVYLCIYGRKWLVIKSITFTHEKHFKTKEKAELAAKLLNEYHKDNKIFGFKLGDK